MALLQDLIKQIDDETLRQRIMAEVGKLSKQKKFGLVFEEHLPECTPLYDVEIRRDSKVALKAGQVSDIYIVRSIDGDKAICEHKSDHAEVAFALDDLVAVAEFGEPIYPYLKPIDTVCNAPDSDLWHTLIEADNYHALQLLEYLYAGKVDCIYIDPPYNTGARDWKYNNDYVDGSDTYRHSKWLSFMEKRLKLAKKLLNPKDSVLIVTIDEKEYLHLGCLLEDLFSDARIQMISSVINPKGVSVINGFKRADEYLFFVALGAAAPVALPLSNEWSPSAIKSSETEKDSVDGKRELVWTSMMRRGSNASRRDRPALYYAIYADPQTHRIVKVGASIPSDRDRDEELDGLIQVLPIRKNGEQGRWQISSTELESRIDQGRVRLGKETAYGFVVNYLPDGEYRKVVDGDYTIEDYAPDGSIIAYRTGGAGSDPWVAPTQWKIALHDASAYGSTLLQSILLTKRFAFPKSLYAVHDTIRFFTANKPKALIIDFFSGSGTTLHAVNLLNAEDGGHRRCIMVTNNEVSDAEAKSLTKQGYKPGDEEWEKLGIARYVTWPRTVCSIEGHDVNGNPLKGNYLGSDIPMADGFKANAAYFKLGFLDKASVRIGRQFREMLPTLWMKAGCFGTCPTLAGQKVPDYVVLPENRMAILNDNRYFAKFAEEVGNVPEIETVYLVTDSDADYRSMSRGLNGKQTYQLYRDYLDNFRINSRR